MIGGVAWLYTAGVAVSLSFWLWLCWWVLRKEVNGKAGEAKGPRSWPLVGAVLSHAANRHRFHEYITEYCRLYTTFRVAYPGFDYLYTALPANIEYILKTNFNNYVKGNFMHDKQKEFLGNGIFNVDGAEWKQQRKIASYEFASKVLKEVSEMQFQKKAVAMAKFLLAEAQEEKSVDMQDLFLRLTFDSYSNLAFGFEMSTLHRNPSPEQLAFVHSFDESNAMVFLRYLDPLWKFKRWLKVGTEAKLADAVATLDGIMFSYIARRKRDIQEEAQKDDVKSNLLSRFLALSESMPDDFTDRKIRDIILNFMIAGRDTTALTLSWFLYAIATNPSIEERLVEELYQIQGLDVALTSDGNFPSEEDIENFAKLLTYEKLTNLHYLQACLQETLRLYPPVPLDIKTAVSDDVLPDGTKVKKGDCVNITPYAMGRMEWLWGEDALEFKPGRFLKGDVCQSESPFKLTAFMAGPRICLGKDFAFLQMKVTAAILLRFFKFEIVSGHIVRYKLMLTLHMSEEGLRMNILPRFRKTSI